MSTAPPLLEVDQLGRSFPVRADGGASELTVLDSVSFTVAAGERVAIVGESGSGKSTLLGLMAGLDTPTRGRVTIDGQDLARLSERALARLRGATCGFIFQGYRLFPTLTASENVRAPLELLGLPDAKNRAKMWLDRVGLGARGEHRPAQLSGGEQQRVALARALAHGPRLLFADEPTGNLDSATGAAMAELLFTLGHDSGAALVLVTHDRALAARAERCITLRDGRVITDVRTATAERSATADAH